MSALIKENPVRADKTPLVTIITATRNAHAYLEESLLSVINQTYPYIEYIIVDGLSDDGTIDIIKKYAAHISHWVSEPDTSMYNAINKAIMKSNGDIIAILNSDDRYYDSSVIAKVVGSMQSADSDGVYGDLIIDYGMTKKYRKVFKVQYEEYLMFGKGSLIPHITLFIKRRCLDAVGLYNESYKYASDYDFILRCLKCCKLMYLPFPIAIFRRHNNSITASGNIRNERIDILRAYGYEQYSFVRRRIAHARLWGKYFVLNFIESLKRSV